MMREIVTSVFVASALVGCAVDAAAQANVLKNDPAAEVTLSPAAEVTLSGTVTSVIGIPDAEGTVGVHMTLETATGPVSVHLGPAMFIGMANFSFSVDDVVEVVGQGRPGKVPIVVARSITLSGRTLTLRDEVGVPAWTPNSDGSDGCGVAHAADVGSE